MSRPWMLLLGWLIGLALVLTWPMALDPVGAVVGHPQCTVGCHVWVLWWAGEHLGDPHSQLLFFPNGADVVTLYGSDLLSPLLLGPLPLPPALKYNLWVLALLVLGGAGAAALGRRLGASWGGAAVAATTWASAPFFQHEILNGTAELLAAAALPWFARAVLDCLDRPGWRQGLALGLLTALGIMASAYNLFFMLLIGLCILLHRLCTRLAPVLGPATLRAGLQGVALSGVLLLPVVLLQLAHGARQTLSRRSSWMDQDPPLPDSFADLSAWVDPRPAVIPAQMPLPGGDSFSYWTTCTVFLGFVSLVLAGLGLYRARGARVGESTRGSTRESAGRPLSPFLLMGLVGMLLAMGPALRLGGEELLLFGRPIPLPAVVLAELFPPFTLTALHAYRYTSVVLVGLVALVSRSVRHPAWALLVLAEALVLSPVPWPAHTTAIPQSPVLEALAARPPGAVLSLPVEREHLGDLSWMLLAQTRHGKPVQDGGIHHRAGAGSTEMFAENPLLLSLATQEPQAWPVGRVARYSLDALVEEGYRYALIPAEEEAAARWLSALIGPPAEADADWLLWDLPPGG